MNTIVDKEKIGNWIVGNLYVVSLDEYPPHQFLNYSSRNDMDGLLERWSLAVEFIYRGLISDVLEFSNLNEVGNSNEYKRDFCLNLAKFDPFDNDGLASVAGEYWLDTQLRASDYCRELLLKHKKTESIGEFQNQEIFNELIDRFKGFGVAWNSTSLFVINR